MDGLFIQGFDSSNQEDSKNLEVVAQNAPEVDSKGAELFAVDAVVVTEATVRRETSAMRPLSPQGRQAQHRVGCRSCALKGHLSAGRVLQRAAIDDVNLSTVTTGHEHILPEHGDVLLHPVVAHGEEKLGILLVPPLRPNAQLGQGVHVHLPVKLHLESLWYGLHQLNLILELSNLKESFLGQHRLHFAKEIDGEVSVHEELPEIGLLLDLLCPCQSHGIHRRAD
mmetsp:Transcript_72335/g.100501  ORF Transcript_72335/g.100501 Transcript_72335/m.100501 type:complete len:225 (-) Transcript_72335:180-854(-)